MRLPSFRFDQEALGGAISGAHGQASHRQPNLFPGKGIQSVNWFTARESFIGECGWQRSGPAVGSPEPSVGDRGPSRAEVLTITCD